MSAKRYFGIRLVALVSCICVGLHEAAAQNAGANATFRAQTMTDESVLNGEAAANVSARSGSALDIEEEQSDQIDLRTFRAPDLLLPTDHLLGDWAGLRTKLEDGGITPSVTWVSNIAGNPVGGKSQGFTECENVGCDFMSDLEKICGMKDAKFHISTSQRSGESLSNEYIGNAFNVQQVYGGETFRLVDMEYIQHFCDNHLSIHSGRIAAGDDFLTSPYYGFFMQNGVDGNPVAIFKNAPGMSGYPNAAWGSRVRVRPSDRSYVMVGVYNGDASVRDNDEHGCNFSMNGPAFVIGEMGYQWNGQPGESGKIGTIKVGAWYDGNDFDNFNQQYLGSSAAQFGLLGETRRGNWGYYVTGDQVILITDKEKQRGVGVFTAILVSPDDEYSVMPFYCSGGVLWRGPLETRPTDSLGFAVIYGDFSESMRNAERAAKQLDPSVEVQGGELAFEWSYRFRMKEGAVFFQPDLQYIVHPNGNYDIANALVVGAQMGVNF